MNPNLYLNSLPPPPTIPGPHTGNPDALYLHLGEAWYPPSPAVVAAIEAAAPSAGRYPDNRCLALRQTLADYVGHRTTPANLMVGNGSDGLIDLIIRGFAFPRGSILAPEPTFFVYRQTATGLGLRTDIRGRISQADGFQLRFDLLHDSLAAKPAVIFLASPNNPTGDQLTDNLLHDILAATDALVVVDECYREFADCDCLELLHEHRNLLVLRSLSKNFALAGLRIGYAVAAPEIIESLEKTDQTFSVNALAQVASVAALGSLDYYQPRFEITRKLREQLVNGLTTRGCRVFPSQANIVLFEWPVTWPEDAPKVLTECGLYLGNFHGKMGMQRCLRVAVPSEKQLRRFFSIFDAV